MADTTPLPILRRPAAPAPGKGLVIQGNLDDTSLLETVQFLQSLRKTGQLALERADTRQSAGIGFVEGRVVHAFCPPLAGEECFHYLLTWRSGRYIFLPNTPSPERTISVDTGTLLLDGLRRLDELQRCLSGLPPRDTVLHRRRDPELLRQARLTFAHLRIWRRLDGQAALGELIDADPDSAAILAELIAAGLAAAAPDHRFLAEVWLAPTLRGAERLNPAAGDLASRLLLACDGYRSLADARSVIGCSPEEAIAAAEYLLALRLLMVVKGAAAAELLG